MDHSAGGQLMLRRCHDPTFSVLPGDVFRARAAAFALGRLGKADIIHSNG